MHPIDTAFWHVLRDVVDEIRRDIDELKYDLEDWFDEMLSQSPIGSEWRDCLRVFVRRWHERGLDLDPQSIRNIEDLMERCVRFEAEYLAAQTADTAFLKSPQLGALNVSDASSGPLVAGLITGADEPPPEMASLPSTGSIEQMRELGKFLADPFYKARIKKIHHLRSVWDDYDQEIASGRHKPGWIEWAGTGVGRMLMPPSPPDIVIEFEDGSKHVIPGGGPSSGQLAGQGLAITAPYGVATKQATVGAAAAAYGRTFARQQVESGIDFVFQEATGSPIGPSTLRSFSSGGTVAPEPPALTSPPLIPSKSVGRTGKQAKLRALADDPDVSSSIRGWIKQDINAIQRGQRKTIRVPVGKNLAHRRGFPAKHGYSYEYTDLQDIDLHKLQHKHEGY